MSRAAEGLITRRSCLKRIALVAAANALPVCLRSRSAFGTEAQTKPSDDEIAAISAIAKEFMDQFKVPGFSVAIARHGQFIYREAFGFADTASGERVTPSHLFRIASTTKPITSVAIFSLVEQGRLKLDDFIFGNRGLLQFDYAKSFTPPLEEITLHHLLTHTAGGWEKGKGDPMFLNPNMNHQDLITWTLAHQPLKNPPGTHYGYSNFGYCLLGRIIEKVTNQSYADFVQQKLLVKCDVKDMRLAGNTLEERASGEVVYYGQNGQNPYIMNVQRMDAHGGWIATPSDLVQFLMHVDGFKTTPNILKDETIKTMTTPSQVNPGYACGWCVNKAPNWWHNGSLSGTSTIIVRTVKGLCWAGFANTRTGSEDIDAALDKTMWKIARAVPAWQA
jgi:CubicO group peptidase (beta-lactamase class C family)